LANDSSNANLFSPGSPSDTVPAGEVERQAIASLRGYTYQVAAAALAWLDLDNRGKVYLEVAEDYATIAHHSLDAVQVKDTAESGSVTLNTEAVREAINAYVTLAARNKDRSVQLRYLTTSPIGTEQKISDRPGGEAGLRYWRLAATGADIGPLRLILTSDKFSEDVRAFVESRDDEALRDDLLRRVHWDCGKPDLAGIVQEIEERLVVLGRELFKLSAPEARRLSNVLLYHVLKKSVLKNASDRVLTRAELYKEVDAATLLSVPRQAVGSILDIGSALATALAAGQTLDATFSATDSSWLIPSSDIATPRAIISRQPLAARVEQALTKHGRVILVGGSGLGKSLLARDVAGKTVPGFVALDLRGVEPSEAVRRLGLTLGRIGTLNFGCLVFDDFNHMDDGSARSALGRCLQALQRRDRMAIVTAYRRPAQKALTELGLDNDAVVEVTYLTEDDAHEIVRAAGGDSEQWGGIAFASGAQGHPQLVHAFVMGMASRGWPHSEVREIVIRGFASDDINAERDATRRGIAAALSDDARTLLYRISLVIGRFDRALVLAIAEVQPPIQRAGELLDNLVGPWIEVVGKDALRVSPLAANAGTDMLAEGARQKIHVAISRQMLSKRTISAGDANSILMHGLVGGDASSLFQLAHAVLTAEEDAAEQLVEHFFVLPLLRTDQPIFPTNGAVTVMLRLAQFKLLASKNKAQDAAACVDALFREIGDEQDVELRNIFEGLALGSVLNTIGIASIIPNWIELLQRLKARIADNSTLQHFKEVTETAAKEANRSFYGAIFSIGMGQLQTIKRLEEILLDLDGLPDTERSVWLESFDKNPAEYSLLVNPPWTAEQQRNELNAPEATERFMRMALLAEKWGTKALAVECHVARAVMFDEYMDDEAGAHAALNDAEASLGKDVVTSRARARIYWRRKKYHDAVAIQRNIADAVGRNSPVDRAFAMREAAICAANTGDWAQAATWFGEADKAAAASGTNDMQVMAIGLEADRAAAYLESANIEEALRTMASCLKRLSRIEPSESLRAGYCHRVVRHTVLWIDSKIDNRKTLIDGTPIQMLPGTCSNPEPPASILDLPLGHPDVAWYMLAEAEASYGGDAGVARSVRAQLKDGPIPFMELTLRNRYVTRDVLDSNAAGFSGHFLPYLAAMEYYRLQGQSARVAFDPLIPARGEIPALSDTELAQPTAMELAADALIAFLLASLFRGIPDPARDLQRNLARAIGETFPGKAVLDKWRGANGKLAELNETVIEGILQLRSGEYLTPRESWEIALRFFEKARQSNFRKILVSFLRGWLRGHWREIVDNGSFRLSRPLQTVPAIEKSLSRDCEDEAFISSLLLAAAEAVGSPLAAAYEAQLKEMASVGK
jgi:hypothetical protein